MDSFIDMFDLENAAAPVKQKRSGYFLMDYPNSVSQGPFCWLSDNHKAAFWRERASKINSVNRGLGYNPLNSSFLGCDAHHLLLENNKDFCINLPAWLHRFYIHARKEPGTLDSINAVALDFWINENIYSELFDL